MSEPRLCSDTDLNEFCPQLDLWLKPHSKITITVTLPTLETVGQCISTWEVMDKLKKRAKPHRFKTLKVIKSSVDFIRFEAECDSKQSMELIIVRLSNVTLKLSGFSQTLHVKTAKVKIGSTRHEWESFFRDNPNMNEMKAGYRPDTIHLQNLPVKWFGGDNPSPNLIVKVFSTFGEIRRFHIPVLDNKTEENEAFKRFNFNGGLNFEAFVQFRDYIGFVKAMDTLRGMKLVKKLSELNNQKNQHIEYDINVDFDRTKHLSDKAIKKRRIAREYGIKSAVELKNLKDETRKQRQKYLERITFLKTRKRSANCVLGYLFSLAENKAKARKQIEDSKQAELKLKERLLSEEVKLREKLLEKRREYLRQQSKGKLKSVANFNNNTVNNVQISSEASSPSLTTLPSIAVTVSSATSSTLTSVVLSNVTSNKIHLNRINRFRDSLASNTNTNNNSNLNLNHNQYYNNINTNSSLYKNHKRGCKYYKPRSIVITKK